MEKIHHIAWTNKIRSLNKIMNYINITIIGLIANLIGAIFLAISFSSTDEKVGSHTDSKGKTTDFVLPNFHKRKFRIGMFFLIIGFLIQIIDSYTTTHKEFLDVTEGNKVVYEVESGEVFLVALNY